LKSQNTKGAGSTTGQTRPLEPNVMFRFLQPNTTVAPAQDVEMGGIGNVVEPSAHTTSPPPVLSPIPPQNEGTVLDPKNMHEILAFMETQKITIQKCMAQVSH
jgi:hypothetical protein